MEGVFGNPQYLLDLVKSALPGLYGVESPFGVSLLRYSENYTFLIESSGTRYILRLSRPGYHTPDELEAEARWMDVLRRETDIPIQQVVRGADGKFIQRIAGRQIGRCGETSGGAYITSSGEAQTYRCCMFSYLNGHCAKDLSGEALYDTLRSIGKIMATFHLHSINRPLALARKNWDYESLFGRDKIWGDWKKYKALSCGDIEIAGAALQMIKNRLDMFGKGSGRFGLIHSDLHMSNIIIDGGKPQVIDFDDCGYGWYLYDIACSTVQYSKELENILSIILSGYEEIRRLSDAERDEIPTFIIMRRIVRFAWLASHADSDTAASVEADYVGKTLSLCDKYLKGRRCNIWEN